MTDDELLVEFKAGMQKFIKYYIERMEACETVEELAKLSKIWTKELDIINKAIFKKD